MRPIRSFLIVFILSLLACHKENNNELQGTWIMIEAYDKVSGQFITPPAIPEKVEITFSGNSFYGHTINNAFGDGHYDIMGNKIRFDTYIATQVLEDEWGGAFISVLNSCLMQSISPCVLSEIMIQGNIMQIITPTQYDIKLEKK